MYTLIIFFTSIIFIAYAILIITYVFAWKKIKFFEPALTEHRFKTRVSILVAARNEEENILILLSSLSFQNFPKSLFEIIIVDDHSEDNTPKIVTDFILNHPLLNIKLLELKKINPTLKNKKAAISQAIKLATGELIITTDADCSMGSNWLATMVSYYETHQPKLIVGPVMLEGKSILENLQIVEFLSLTTLTGGSIKINKPLMCNGANLAYPKVIYEAVNGFDDNQTLASGDDTFLMFKILKKYQDGIHFLKSSDAIVKTKAQKSLSELISQRIRWASKTSIYNNRYINIISFIILLSNLSLITLGLLSIFELHYLNILLITLITKIIIDTLLLTSSDQLFKTGKLNPFTVGVLTLAYPVYLLVVIVKKQQGYKWKGRDLK